jgi:hypothetical protein
LNKELYFKHAVKTLNKRRKKKKLVTTLKIRRKYQNNSSNVVLKSGFINRYIGNRKIGRLRKRGRFIKFRRFMRRRKKFDARVSVVDHDGQLVRCITKVGNRKIYRPLKRKFPKW